MGGAGTGESVDVPLDAFGDRLHSSAEFAGRGGPSRGGLLVRHVAARQELTCAPSTVPSDTARCRRARSAPHGLNGAAAGAFVQSGRHEATEAFAARLLPAPFMPAPSRARDALRLPASARRA